MTAIEKLRKIQQYYESTRAVGHTEGMICGINETHAPLVLIHQYTMKPYIEKQLYAPSKVKFESINSSQMLLGMNRPLFIDNAALTVLLTKAFEEIDAVRLENTKLKRMLQLA